MDKNEVEEGGGDRAEDGEGEQTLEEEHLSTILASLVTALKHKEKFLAVCSIDLLHHHHPLCRLQQELLTL